MEPLIFSSDVCSIPLHLTRRGYSNRRIKVVNAGYSRFLQYWKFQSN